MQEPAPVHTVRLRGWAQIADGPQLYRPRLGTQTGRREQEAFQPGADGRWKTYPLTADGLQQGGQPGRPELRRTQTNHKLISPQIDGFADGPQLHRPSPRSQASCGAQTGLHPGANGCGKEHPLTANGIEQGRHPGRSEFRCAQTNHQLDTC